MTQLTFDAKFGADLVATAPTGPGVYRFLDRDGQVLYVGKAKNLRRRLSNYRNASRKRVHRKMRLLVRASSLLTYETSESEPAALLREGELIRELRPHYNVEGAFSFLYPTVGLAISDKRVLLCFTTHPEEFRELGLDWYGCYRSRPRVKAAFLALVEILGLVAHREKRTRLPPHPRLKGSLFAGFRQVPRDVTACLSAFLSGEVRNLPSVLSRLLLEHPAALQRAAAIQQQLQELALFFERDAARLRAALTAVGRDGHHVTREERDALFIRAFSKE